MEFRALYRCRCFCVFAGAILFEWSQRRSSFGIMVCVVNNQPVVSKTLLKQPCNLVDPQCYFFSLTTISINAVSPSLHCSRSWRSRKLYPRPTSCTTKLHTMAICPLWCIMDTHMCSGSLCTACLRSNPNFFSSSWRETGNSFTLWASNSVQAGDFLFTWRRRRVMAIITSNGRGEIAWKSRRSDDQTEALCPSGFEVIRWRVYWIVIFQVLKLSVGTCTE